ncbi:MAG: reverse transcriptase family protein [Ilumatobacter sp.]|uniref:reverse transcriptase family protein n=1 Tax=Ilumatobacter sp. TaxID=1967498 RepID=UPI00391D0F29
MAKSLGREDSQIERARRETSSLEGRGLPSILTLNHLSRRTGVSYRYLRSIVGRRHDPYRTFTVSRRNSRKGRPIAVPEPVLMEVQRWLLRRVLHRLSPHRASYAYHPGSSIKSCAQEHCGARWLVKVDLHDFYTNIKEPDVYDVFVAAGYSPLVSLELARLCTRDGAFVTHIDRERLQIRNYDDRGVRAYRTGHLGYLPQGAPTSGAISNLVAEKLDIGLDSLAQDASLVYTRYADDITLSTTEAFTRSNALAVVRQVGDICRLHGFELHRAKTRIVPPGARHIVLGLLVDDETPRLTRQFKSRIATHTYGVERFGLSAHARSRNFSSLQGLVNHVNGLIRFALDIEPKWSVDALAKWRAALLGGGWPLGQLG